MLTRLLVLGFCLLGVLSAACDRGPGQDADPVPNSPPASEAKAAKPASAAAAAQAVAPGAPAGDRTPIHVALTNQLTESGISVERVELGAVTDHHRSIDVHLRFDKPFSGSLELLAMNHEDREMDRATADLALDVSARGTETRRFAFDKAIRFSEAKVFRLQSKQGPDLTVAKTTVGVAASRLRVISNTVMVNAVFEKPYSGSMELRAFDDAGADLGRARLAKPIEVRENASQALIFPFAASVPLSNAKRFELSTL